jgi:type IV secretory pathway VirB4 component
MAKQLGMHVILEWLIEKFMKKNPNRRKRVVIDEAQKLLDSPHQAKAIEDIYRRFRKYSGSAMAASQDFLKFVENEQGRAIVQNSSIKVLLKQAKNDRQAVLDITGIEEHEFDTIALYSKGQSLCIVGDERFTNIVNPSAYELELYNTTHVMGEAERMRQRQRWVVG